ncbi:MAG TPA: NADH-quinone oxidoreductase subunit I [Desulfobacterales bacterium]|nr:NADH-quinone oxidoreductase subunit I [Desulfobacterales bacterium]
MAYVKETVNGFISLLAGLAVTIRYFVKPIVTVQYPREKLTLSPRYRGHIEFIIDEETGSHRCTACENCMRTCPSKVITVTGVKVAGSKKKRAVTYQLDYSLCSLCGLCVEVCPTNALKFSDEYRLAGYSRKDMVIDVMARLQAQQRALGLAEEVPPIPEPEEPKVKAEVATGEGAA